MFQVSSHAALLDRISGQPRRSTKAKHVTFQWSDQAMEEDFSMDFSDTLFTTLNQPFAFPNPKEMCM